MIQYIKYQVNTISLNKFYLIMKLKEKNWNKKQEKERGEKFSCFSLPLFSIIFTKFEVRIIFYKMILD